jgi:hypothetical protein
MSEESMQEKIQKVVNALMARTSTPVEKKRKYLQSYKNMLRLQKEVTGMLKGSVEDLEKAIAIVDAALSELQVN